MMAGYKIEKKAKKLTREERLEQMRAAQAKLRQQRSFENDKLKQERDKLRQQVADLQQQMAFPSDGLHKHTQIYDPRSIYFGGVPAGFDLNRITIDKQKTMVGPGEQDAPKIYTEKQIAMFVVKQSVYCIAKHFALNHCQALQKTVFRFTPPAARTEYFHDLIQVVENRGPDAPFLRAPTVVLPKGVLNLMDACQFITRYIPINGVDFSTLVHSIARNCFATVWGPCIFVTDLMGVAQSAMSDHQNETITCLGELSHDADLTFSRGGITEVSTLEDLTALVESDPDFTLVTGLQKGL
jgi:hypothetical protein